MRNIPPRIHTLLFASVVLFVTSAQGIKVKFGTNDGPIVPPTPESRVVPAEPYRIPAPVWEYLPEDIPDPNANWRPLFMTNVAPYGVPIWRAPTPQQTSAQRFVQAYLPSQKRSNPPPYFVPAAIPDQMARNSHAAPVPAQALPSQATSALPQSTMHTHVTSEAASQESSQGVPAAPVPRSFVPIFVKSQPQKDQVRQKEVAQNQLDYNEVDNSNSDWYDNHQLQYEKERGRTTRSSSEGSHAARDYINWPMFVPHRQQFYYQTL